MSAGQDIETLAKCASEIVLASERLRVALAKPIALLDRETIASNLRMLASVATELASTANDLARRLSQ